MQFAEADKVVFLCCWKGSPQCEEGQDLPSGAAEEHNSLWPCHEGAPLQTCREEQTVIVELPPSSTLILQVLDFPLG